MTKNKGDKQTIATTDTGISRRTAFKTAGVLAGAAAAGAAGAFAPGSMSTDALSVLQIRRG